MQNEKNTRLLVSRSTLLVGALLGALGVLGYASQEAAYPAHRHVIEGKIVTHDHLDSGHHQHAPEAPTAPDDGEPSGRSPAEDQVYLGQVSVPIFDDEGVDLIVEVTQIWTAASAIDVSRAHPSPHLSRPPGRGPPTPLFAAAS